MRGASAVGAVLLIVAAACIGIGAALHVIWLSVIGVVLLPFGISMSASRGGRLTGILWKGITFLLIIGCLGIAGWGLWESVSPVTPRESLKEVRGQVALCRLVEYSDGTAGVRARLFGYDPTLVFGNPDEKVDAVYLGLLTGRYIVVLVDEGSTFLREEPIARIWEARSRDNVFLHYEEVAQWEKSNKRAALAVGLGFLGGGGLFVFLAIRGMKKGWFK